MLINICICTCNRPELLQACLTSLQQMQRPDAIDLAITVVDNDAGGSAHSVVESFREQGEYSLVYQVEQQRGIPCARNRALAIAREMQADSIVFIDDDETVREDWLIELVRVSALYGHKAAVHGLVMPQLEASVPASVADLFTPRVRTEGQKLSACATDNVMIPMGFINHHGLMFDTSRPLAGGTDTIFFTQAHQQGLEIYQTNRAVVDETIPRSRATLKWFMRRKFRAGLTDAWRKLQHGRAKPMLIASASFQVMNYTLRALSFQILMSPLKRNAQLLKAAKYAGVFMGCFNMEVDSYKVIDK